MLTLPTVNLQAYKRTRNRQTSKTIIQFREIYFALLKKKKQKTETKKQQQQQKKRQTNAKKKKQKQIETKQKQFKTNKLRLLNGNCSFT